MSFRQIAYIESWDKMGMSKYIRDVFFPSAGVGRTGVFLAIDMILEKLEKGLISSIDVFGEVCAMRERRMNMIQTLVCAKIFICDLLWTGENVYWTLFDFTPVLQLYASVKYI